MENVITIPRKLTQKGDLVVLPRKEYEEFVNWQKSVKTYKPTTAEKRELEQARKDFAKGNYLTLKELEDELADYLSS